MCGGLGSSSNYLGLVLVMSLKICSSVIKVLKLKVIKILRLIQMLGAVTGEKHGRINEVRAIIPAALLKEELFHRHFVWPERYCYKHLL